MAAKQRRQRIGDIVVIQSPDGAAYARFTHKHEQYGALLSVLGPSRGDPPALARLAALPVQFRTFFPLGAACRRGIATVIGHAELPADEQPFPLFRAGMRDPSTGRVARWWLWDGEHEWPVDALTDEQMKLPIREIINDTLLIERARDGWSAEQEQ